MGLIILCLNKTVTLAASKCILLLGYKLSLRSVFLGQESTFRGVQGGFLPKLASHSLPLPLCCQTLANGVDDPGECQEGADLKSLPLEALRQVQEYYVRFPCSHDKHESQRKSRGENQICQFYLKTNTQVSA